MPNKADKNKPKESVEPQAPAQPQAPAPVYAIAFQLEDVAIHGRKIAFDILKKLLAEHKIALTPPLFSRYCVNSTPQTYLPTLVEPLGIRKLSVEKLVETVTGAIAEQALSNGTKINPGLFKILRAARERNFVIAVISGWTEAVGQTLLGKLGLNELSARLFTFNDTGRTFPTADVWLKTTKAISIKPRHCLVLGGSMAVCKSAMSADLRCVTLPDEFTAFQDFAGADLVLENLEEMSAKTILNTVFPHSEDKSTDK